MAQFCIEWLEPGQAEAFMDHIVHILNAHVAAEEFTPAKYPDLYTYCPKCGKVTERPTRLTLADWNS